MPDASNLVVPVVPIGLKELTDPGPVWLAKLHGGVRLAGSYPVMLPETTS